MQNKAIKFSQLPVDALFQFWPGHPDSKFKGTYRKVSPRKFTDGDKVYKCAASATVQPNKDILN